MIRMLIFVMQKLMVSRHHQLIVILQQSDSIAYVVPSLQKWFRKLLHSADVVKLAREAKGHWINQFFSYEYRKVCEDDDPSCQGLDLIVWHTLFSRGLPHKKPSLPNDEPKSCSDFLMQTQFLAWFSLRFFWLSSFLHSTYPCISWKPEEMDKK